MKKIVESIAVIMCLTTFALSFGIISLGAALEGGELDIRQKVPLSLISTM